MLIYQEFLAINEELAAFDPADKLRWAVHEIIIKLKTNEEIKFTTLSKRLKEEYKVDISSELLKDIFTNWDRTYDAEYAFFKKDDKNWLEVWPYAGYAKKKTRDKQSFGKHRKKDTTAGRGTYRDYSYGYGYGYNQNYNYGKKKDKDAGEIDSRYPYGGEYYGD